MEIMIFLMCSVIIRQSIFWSIVTAAPGLGSKSWPPMKGFHIWDNSNRSLERAKDILESSFLNGTDYRQKKVLNFFPVPVDDECLSDDNRRSGICLNVYECRMKGGNARGECALGFGVCCVFTVSCDQEISNNITFIMSPNFPSSMPINLTTCKVKIKMISSDISQIRIDFNHFSLGQPNRKTGICDGDIFQVSGGPEGPFVLCGQNSGQHIYYDVGERITARQKSAVIFDENKIPDSKNQNCTTNDNQTNSITYNENAVSNNAEMEDIEIFMNFTSRIIPSRLWEIRILQIPFSQRAPAGCLQYFSAQQGIIQTFNFADNGRHLANQDYRACIRQEFGMCSISYQTCDEHSFRIGPTTSSDEVNEIFGNDFSDGVISTSSFPEVNPVISSTVVPIAAGTSTATPIENEASSNYNVSSTPVQADTSECSVQSDEPTVQTTATTPVPLQSEATSEADSDALNEGSGGNDIPAVSTSAPVRGGFDILSYFRSIFDFRRRRRSQRYGRQMFPSCTDRITMPCIVEDFIGTELGTIPNCEPVHCGDKFCSSGSNLCRIESTVTPFYLGVHFGDGTGKGSPEENIGACLKYTQMPCM